MMRPVLGTVATRVIIAAINLLLIAVAAQALGLSGVGRMSLLLLAITFVLLLSNMLAGGLVYLEPRHGTRTLRRLSYAWSAMACAAAYPLASWIGLAPAGLAGHACALAFVESVSVVHLNLLLGRERYAQHNALQLMRAVLLLGSFMLLLRIDGADVMDYVQAIYVAQTATALLSALALARKPGQRSDAVAAAGALFRQGLPGQTANGLQLLTYRLSYYLMDRFQGASALGLWSISTQLAESAWLAPKSLGAVLYARVSNVDERDRQRDLTLAVLKLSVSLAAFAALILIALPESVFQWAFGREVSGIGALVLLLLPGLLAMAASQALSHYLSGTGRVLHNTIASGIGLMVTMALGFTLIPAHGLQGAAMTSSAAYSAAVLYQAVVFRRFSGARLPHWLPSAADADRLATAWRKLRGR